MSKFGRIDTTETSFEEYKLYKNQTITSASDGVNLVYAIKDDYEDQMAKVPTDSGSHWAFVHNMFYRSGSTKVLETNSDEAGKFNSIYHQFNTHHDLKPFYTNKFYDNISIFYIPQQNIGDRIKSGSFQLVARTGSISNISNQIIIRDDGNGNLYSTNAEHSQSVSSLSSQDNYVGNIFYELGVAVLTETASWSGSVNYVDIGKKTTDGLDDYRYWHMDFNSTTPFYTTEYVVNIKSGQFDTTMNDSSVGNGSVHGHVIPSIQQNQLIPMLTSSGWTPYFNQLQLYRHRDEEPALIANLPRAVKTTSEIDLIISFRMDH